VKRTRTVTTKCSLAMWNTLSIYCEDVTERSDGARVILFKGRNEKSGLQTFWRAWDRACAEFVVR
jgi:hypothetical protein